MGRDPMASSPIPPPAGRQPTIYDISRHADVAVSTVSKVLGRRSEAYPISSETRARVLRAAQELGYELDPVRRPRRGRRSGVIAVVYGTMAPPNHAVYEPLSERLGQLVADEGCRLELLSASTWDDLRHLLNRHPMDGCLLIPYLPPGDPDPRIPFTLPMVILNDRADLPVPHVWSDEGIGQELVVEHLFGLGHHRLLYADIDDRPRSHSSEVERLEAFHRALSRRNLELRWCRGDAATVIDRALAEDVTAIVTYNNQLAVHLVPELRRRGLRAPQDLSLVCGSDFKAAALVGLTSVVVPMVAMAERACHELFDLIHGEVDPGRRELVLPPTLVVRESTGPVPTRGPAAG